MIYPNLFLGPSCMLLNFVDKLEELIHLNVITALFETWHPTWVGFSYCELALLKFAHLELLFVAFLFWPSQTYNSWNRPTNLFVKRVHRYLWHKLLHGIVMFFLEFLFRSHKLSIAWETVSPIFKFLDWYFRIFVTAQRLMNSKRNLETIVPFFYERNCISWSGASSCLPPFSLCPKIMRTYLRMNTSWRRLENPSICICIIYS